MTDQDTTAQRAELEAAVATAEEEQRNVQRQAQDARDRVAQLREQLAGRPTAEFGEDGAAKPKSQAAGVVENAARTDGMLVLVRQPHGLEGLIARWEQHNSGDLPVADSPQHRAGGLDLNATHSPTTPPAYYRDHVLARLDQFFEVKVAFHPRLVPGAEPRPDPLVTAVEACGQPLACEPSGIPLNFRVVQRMNGLSVAACDGLVNPPHHLQVLLRHRPPSIPPQAGGVVVLSGWRVRSPVATKLTQSPWFLKTT